jgi:hypothetical protein
VTKGAPFTEDFGVACVPSKTDEQYSDAGINSLIPQPPELIFDFGFEGFGFGEQRVQKVFPSIGKSLYFSNGWKKAREQAQPAFRGECPR